MALIGAVLDAAQHGNLWAVYLVTFGGAVACWALIMGGDWLINKARGR